MGRGVRNFHLLYRMDKGGDIKVLDFPSYSKLSACMTAPKAIAKAEGRDPYSVWAHSVTQLDGKTKLLKSTEENPY